MTSQDSKKIIAFQEVPNKGWQIYCGLGKVPNEENNLKELFIIVSGKRKGFTYSEFKEILKDKSYRVGKIIIKPKSDDVEFSASLENLGAEQTSIPEFLSLLGYNDKEKAWT